MNAFVSILCVIVRTLIFRKYMVGVDENFMYIFYNVYNIVSSIVWLWKGTLVSRFLSEYCWVLVQK